MKDPEPTPMKGRHLAMLFLDEGRQQEFRSIMDALKDLGNVDESRSAISGDGHFEAHFAAVEPVDYTFVLGAYNYAKTKKWSIEVNLDGSFVFACGGGGSSP